MRPDAIVVITPCVDLTASVEQIAEPAHAQTLLAEAAVEAFDQRVLDRLARPDVHQIDAALQAPGQVSAARDSNFFASPRASLS